MSQFLTGAISRLGDVHSSMSLSMLDDSLLLIASNLLKLNTLISRGCKTRHDWHAYRSQFATLNRTWIN